MNPKEKFYQIDFLNHVVYSLDKDLITKLIRYVFDNNEGMITFLINSCGLKFHVQAFERESIKNTLPSGYCDIPTYTRLHGLTRQTVYNRIKRKELKRIRKGKFVFILPNLKHR